MENIFCVVDTVSPFNDLKIKNNAQDRYYDEVVEAIKLREKRLKHFKSKKLYTDKELHEKSKCLAMKLIKEKKNKFFKEKLIESIGKLKELWKAQKSLGLTSKKGSISNICLETDDKIIVDDKTIANTFKEFFCNLASDLVAKLPPQKSFILTLLNPKLASH